MTEKIVELIIEKAGRTAGQDVAARLHSVLMEVRQAVAKVIVVEQKKERKQARQKESSVKKLC